MLFRDNI